MYHLFLPPSASAIGVRLAPGYVVSGTGPFPGIRPAVVYLVVHVDSGQAPPKHRQCLVNQAIPVLFPALHCDCR